ncbi:MAG TPA: methyl-accepting chemotaxis protein, partial [Chromobacteriaceae bacterium]|nr:methyl-accepting chemotaxis protein [Chromobacteriaceae bacterium]
LRKENAASYQRAKWSLISAVTVLLLIVAGLGYKLSTMISRRMERFSGLMTEISQSLDFTQRMKITSMDELGRSADAFNKLLDKLQTNLKAIYDEAQQVAGASQALSQTADQVSTAAAAQSEASANMAATVEQMTVSVNHVADQTRQTHDLSAEAGQLAKEGSEIINQTIQDMHEIAQSVTVSAKSIQELEAFSGQVTTVVGIIGEIADQTNLLALNAAIEAARAGEQGRGFAVVADEVRKLAERTTKSTQEISGIISTMLERSHQAAEQMQAASERATSGVSRTDAANDAMRRIGMTSDDTAHRVSEISAAISQQGEASNNISVQVEKIAQMSEESSAAAQHTAASAVRLDELAQRQIAELSNYKL